MSLEDYKVLEALIIRDDLPGALSKMASVVSPHILPTLRSIATTIAPQLAPLISGVAAAIVPKPKT